MYVSACVHVILLTCKSVQTHAVHAVHACSCMFGVCFACVTCFLCICVCHQFVSVCSHVSLYVLLMCECREVTVSTMYVADHKRPGQNVYAYLNQVTEHVTQAPTPRQPHRHSSVLRSHQVGSNQITILRGGGQSVLVKPLD